ncbi:MAG TPA: hypothetical protein VEY07_01640 [Thermoplasmata archaeon]|nr:hypothetical protein [Thermoplasmata archaeon]
MTESSWYTWVAAGMALVVVVGLVAGLGLGSNFGSPGGTKTGGANSAPAYLYLTIAFNPQNGMDQYFPANFSVPANTMVHFVVTNYDNGHNVVASQYTQVLGTVGGVSTWVNSSMSTPVTAGAVPSAEISHTFTLENGGYMLNVPIPMATDAANPTTVTFSAFFNSTGTFTWECMAPCDPGSMVTPGYMAGTVTVVPA